MVRKGLFAAGCLFACGSPAPPTSVTLASGPYALAVTAGGAQISLTRAGGAELLSFPADAFQLGVVPALDNHASYDPYWLEVGSPPGSAPAPAPGLSWLTAESATLSSGGPDATITLAFSRGFTATLSLHAAEPGTFSALLVPHGPASGSAAVAYIRLRPRASATEAFYGLGELEESVNSRGKLRPMQMEGDTSTESNDNEVHFPIPLIIGTTGWGLFVESKRVGLFNVAPAAEPSLVEITYGTAEQSDQGLSFYLFAAEAPIDITKLYYGVTGYPRLPATWALGPWIWRDDTQGQLQVLSDLSALDMFDLPTSGFWFDRPYATAVNTFDFAGNFPDPPPMLEAIHAAGIRYAVWHAPYLEAAALPYVTEATSRGYFPPVVPTERALPARQWGSPLDLTNPGAYALWQSLLKKYTDVGVEGFKLDYGEDVVPALGVTREPWGFHDGSDERTMHYEYTRLYHRAYAEMLPESGSYLLCRDGRWGDQTSVSVVWPGDMDANLAHHGDPYVDHTGKSLVAVGGLPATIIMGLSLGPSGFPFFASDTGGYVDSPPNNETFTRWFEQTALSPVMNVGDQSTTSTPWADPPWVFTKANGRNQTTLDTYRAYARLHMRLFPFEWTYAAQLATTGRPIMRPLGLAYPELGVHPSDEYLFGEELLVAPVIVPGAVTRTLVLPPGDWVSWWDGTTYTGGAGGEPVTVPAPLDTLPLFLKAGGAVPLLRPTIQRMAPVADTSAYDSFATRAGVLWVRLVPSATGAAFTLYDGGSVRVAPTGRGMSYAVAPGSVFHDGAVLESIHAPSPSGVTREGVAVPKLASAAAVEASASGWFWETALGGRLWLHVAADGVPVVVAR